MKEGGKKERKKERKRVLNLFHNEAFPPTFVDGKKSTREFRGYPGNPASRNLDCWWAFALERLDYLS